MDILEMTIQFRVKDFEEGKRFYQGLLQRNPDFVPHEGFAEWELLRKCWLQIAEGEPTPGSGPLRLGVNNIERERTRIISTFGVDVGEICSRGAVPVQWCTLADPWGNRLGLFESLVK